MNIDPATGCITLPNGFTLNPDSTQDEFRVSRVGTGARSRDCGTLPWIHYRFDGGRINGNELIVSLCCYDQMLIDASLTVSLYPEHERGDWTHDSTEVEAETKRLHEQLLEEQLGKPSSGAGRLAGRLARLQDTLKHRIDWRFKWGVVSSIHDSRGGGTFINVAWGDRREQAAAIDNSRRAATASGARA